MSASNCSGLRISSVLWQIGKQRYIGVDPVLYSSVSTFVVRIKYPMSEFNFSDFPDLMYIFKGFPPTIYRLYGAVTKLNKPD